MLVDNTWAVYVMLLLQCTFSPHAIYFLCRTVVRASRSSLHFVAQVNHGSHATWYPIFHFCFSSLLLRSRPSFSLSLVVVTQIRGYNTGSSPLLPTTARALHFLTREDFSRLFPRGAYQDELRTCVPALRIGCIQHNILLL